MLPSAWRVLINRQVFPEPISGLEHFGVLGMSQRVKQANACSACSRASVGLRVLVAVLPAFPRSVSQADPAVIGFAHHPSGASVCWVPCLWDIKCRT